MLRRFHAKHRGVPAVFPRGRRFDILVCTAGLCALFCAAHRAHATTAKQDAQAALASALDADELVRATIARQVGDATLVSALHQTEDVALRLAAVRCSPYLNDPDRVLGELAQLARGSDPELAPAAALRVFWIAQALTQRGAFERSLESVGAARRELLGLAADGSALERIRVLAGQASFLLGQLSPAPLER